MIYGIEKVESYAPKTKRSRLWSWIKTNSAFLWVQCSLLAVSPIVLFFGWMMRGYIGFGSEMLLILAPSIYRFFKWVIEYDD